MSRDRVDTKRGVGTALRAAAPARGLRFGGWVRGCALACLAAGAALADDVIALPSGQSVTLLETFAEPDSGTIRLRYLAPDIGSPMTRPSFEKLGDDLGYLCDTFGLDAWEASAFSAGQIVISLSAEPVEFGVISPDVEQVFEAFTVENGACMLEMF